MLMQRLKHFGHFLNEFIADFLKNKLGMVIWSVIITIVMGAGVWMAIFLRLEGLTYGTIVIPSLIVEVFGAIFAYQLFQNFFPKAKPARAEPSDLPERKLRKA